MSSEPPAKIQGKIIGWRVWNVTNELELRSAAHSEVWDSGVNKARCLINCRHPGSPHKPPTAGCHCGLHAYYSYEEAVNHGGMIVGMVLAWGKVILQTNGFRAEYAKPVLLVGDENTSPMSALISGEVAKRYKLPLVHDLTYAYDYAEERGGHRVPESMIPQPEVKQIEATWDALVTKLHLEAVRQQFNRQVYGNSPPQQHGGYQATSHPYNPPPAVKIISPAESLRIKRAELAQKLKDLKHPCA